MIEVAGVLLDLDGVIVDSARDGKMRWERFRERHGIEASEWAKLAEGRRTREVVELFVSKEIIEGELEWFDSIDTGEGAVAEMNGSKALLDSLTGVRWGIVTSCPGDLARERLGRLDIAIPRVLVGAEDVELGKPSPEGYLAGLKELGLDPTEAVIFEDAPAGVSAAKAAGVTVVGLRTSFSSLPGVRYTIEDLTKVRVVDKFEGGVRLELTVVGVGEARSAD